MGRCQKVTEDIWGGIVAAFTAVTGEDVKKKREDEDTEKFYRTMSEKEYQKLVMNKGKLTKREKGSSELKVTMDPYYVLGDLSQRRKQKKKYTRTVEFEVKAGTSVKLLAMGGTHESARDEFPMLPPFRPGSGQVEIKYEKNKVLSFGLGSSEPGLMLFNESIVSWREIK